MGSNRANQGQMQQNGDTRGQKGQNIFKDGDCPMVGDHPRVCDHPMDSYFP